MRNILRKLCSFFTLRARKTSLPISKAAIKLQSFLHLPMGWQFGCGVAFSPSTISTAGQLLDYVESKGYQADVFPAVDGDVVVAMYGAPFTDYALRVHSNRRISISSETNADVDIENLTFRDALEFIRKIPNDVWNLHSYFTHNILIKGYSDFDQHNLNHQVQMQTVLAESLLSESPVLKIFPAQCVITSQPLQSTPASALTPLCIGSFIQIEYVDTQQRRIQPSNFDMTQSKTGESVTIT